MDINIRELTTKDMYTVIDLLMKVGKTRLTTIFVGDDTKAPSGDTEDLSTDKTMQLGMTVLSELYENLNEDLKKWFASLCNMDLEEYYNTPIDTTIKIIDFLIESEKTKDFFSQSLQVYSKMSAL